MRKKREIYVPSTPIGFRWVDWLEEYPVGDQRHNEARELARMGAVTDLRLEPGTVEAAVTGMRMEHLHVNLEFVPIEKAKWDKVWQRLDQSPEAKKEFRRGLMGPEVEAAFDEEGLKVLPERYKEIKTICSCGDWMRPCPHALATLRLLGEEIERNVTVLTRLRGDVEEVTLPVVVEETETEPMRPDSFWDEGVNLEEMRLRLLETSTARRLLKRLGPIAVYGVKTDLDILFKPVYDSVETEAKQMLEPKRRENS